MIPFKCKKKKRKYSTYVKLWSLLQSIPLLCWMLIFTVRKISACFSMKIPYSFILLKSSIFCLFNLLASSTAPCRNNTKHSKTIEWHKPDCLGERVYILSPLSLRLFPHFVLWIWSSSSKRETSLWIRLPKKKNNFFAFWKLLHVSISLSNILQHHLCY